MQKRRALLSHVSVVLLTLCCLGITSVVARNPPSHFCVTWNFTELCVGGDNALLSTDVRLTYSYSDDGNLRTTLGPTIRKNNVTEMVYFLSYNVSAQQSHNLEVEYHFKQLEHGGGYCNCLVITINCSPGSTINLCGGYASHPRHIKAVWSAQSPGQIQTMEVAQVIKTLPFTLNCTREPYIKISFQLIRLDVLDILEEGVEFSVRVSSLPDEWIPLKFIHHNLPAFIPPLHVQLRGYTVSTVIISNETEEFISVNICNFGTENAYVQFRWLQTSSVITNNRQDIWLLDNINISIVNFTEITLLKEDFNSDFLNTSIWPEHNIRNGQLGSFDGINQTLVFGNTSNANPELGFYNTISRSLLTNKLSLIQPQEFSNASFVFSITPTEVFNSSSVYSSQSSIISTSIEVPVPTDVSLASSESIAALEAEIINIIMQNEELRKITFSERNITERILELDKVTSRQSENILVSVYLFAVVAQSQVDDSFSELILQDIIRIGNNILQSQKLMSSFSAFAGLTSVLFVFDSLLFSYAPDDFIFVFPNIVLQSQVILVGENTSMIITAINSTAISQGGPELSITLPLELLQEFTDDQGTVRIVSVIYRNISTLFLNNLQNNSSLGSDIVGTAIQCGIDRCPTSNVSLETSNVTITFDHSRDVQDTLEQTDVEVQCVFLSVQDTSDILKIGRWSTRGCTRNTRLSSTSRTVCDCNHLTHFAILLSPRPPTFSEPIILSFSVIAYVGITVSVVAMTVTVIIFCILSFNKKNSLSIAQITYIAGVDRTGPPGDDIPVHCQVIAVLLHYFFLVSFMWMLMEGVLLYLALVRVFVSRTKSYMFLFTSLSYGVPLLYLCVTVPLGIIYSGYGNERACFLNSTNKFIWSFTAPVILILFLNVCFFIMAALISWRQHKRRVNDSNAKIFRGWLKSLIPLVIVLGLTWIIGLLVLEVEALVPLAYIYTFTVAFQGLFIFVVLVLFSKQVRTDCWKWWSNKIFKKKSSNYTTSSNFKSIALEARDKVKKGGLKKYDIHFVASNPVAMN